MEKALAAASRGFVDGQGSPRIGDLLAERSCAEPRSHLLSRLLASCKGDSIAATEALLKDLQWRRETGVDQVGQKNPDDVLGVEPTAVAARFKCKEQGKDRQGRGVLYFQGSSFDAAAILKLTSLDQYTMYHAWWREGAILRASRTRPNVPPPYYLAVIDLKHVRLAQASREFYSIIRNLAELDHRHYPGLVGHVLIINAPFFFAMVWRAIKECLGVQVEKNCTIVGPEPYDTLNALSRHIDLNEIPENYGGSGPTLTWDHLDSTWTESYEGQLIDSLSLDAVAGGMLSNSNSHVSTSPSPSSDASQALSPGSSSIVTGAGEAEQALKDVHNLATKAPDMLWASSIAPLHVAEYQALRSKVEDTLNTRASASEEDEPPTALSDATMQSLASPLPQIPVQDRTILEKLPTHIAQLVSESSTPPRNGLREELINALEVVAAERDSLERYILTERKLLRARLRAKIGTTGPFSPVRDHVSSALDLNSQAQSTPLEQGNLNTTANQALVKAALVARIAALRKQLDIANENCKVHERSVRYAKQHIEKLASTSDSMRASLQYSINGIERENRLLEAAIEGFLGPKALALVK